MDLALPAVDGPDGLEVVPRGAQPIGHEPTGELTSQSGSGAVMMTSQTSSAAGGIVLLQLIDQLPGRLLGLEVCQHIDQSPVRLTR